MYLMLTRLLQQLDPSAALSTVLLQPVKSYLRLRPDTLHCLVRIMLKNGMGRHGGDWVGAYMDENENGDRTVAFYQSPPIWGAELGPAVVGE